MQAQTLSGTSSLLTIPVAHMPEDGTVTLGAGYVDGKYAAYTGGSAHYTTQYAALTFLPFVEVGMRFTRNSAAEHIALGDRMVLVRVQALPEGRVWPAVALGTHDFLKSSDASTNRFNALYVVASKQWDTGTPAGQVALHAGYGSDLLDAAGHEFVGPFGGLSVRPFPFWQTLAEYDGRYINLGQRFLLFKHLDLTVGLQNFQSLIGGGTVHFRL